MFLFYRLARGNALAPSHKQIDEDDNIVAMVVNQKWAFRILIALFIIVTTILTMLVAPKDWIPVNWPL